MILALALVAEGLLYCLQVICSYFMEMYLPTIQKIWIVCAVGGEVPLAKAPHRTGNVGVDIRTHPLTVGIGGRGIMDQTTVVVEVKKSQTAHWNYVNTTLCGLMLPRKTVAE